MSQVDNLDSDRESIGDMAPGALRDILFEVCLVLARNPAMGDTLTSRLTTLAALGSVNTDLRAFVQEVAMPEIQRREVHPPYYDDHQRLRKPTLMDLAMMTNDEPLNALNASPSRLAGSLTSNPNFATKINGQFLGMPNEPSASSTSSDS